MRSNWEPYSKVAKVFIEPLFLTPEFLKLGVLKFLKNKLKKFKCARKFVF